MYLNRHALIPSHHQGTQICLPVRQADVPYDGPHSLSYLFHRFSKFIGGFSLLRHLNVVRIHKKNSLGIAEGDALGIAIAEIAFHRHSFFDIKEGMIERAGHNASLASNAKIFIDDDSMIEFGLPVAGLGWAHFKAIGFFTVITDQREVNSRMFPFKHFNPGTTWIARPGMIDGAHEFALTASRALLLIDD
jgi:hypothetical protein